LTGLLVFAALSPAAAEEPTPKPAPKKTSKSDQKDDGLSNIDRSTPESMARGIKKHLDNAKEKHKPKNIKKMMEKQKKAGMVIMKKGEIIEIGKEKNLIFPRLKGTVEPMDPKEYLGKGEDLLKDMGKDGHLMPPNVKRRPSRVAAVPANTTPVKGSLLARTRSTMAAKRLADDETNAIPYEPPPATLVELDVDRPLVPVGHVEPKVRSVDFGAKPPERKQPENIDEIREEAERRFVQGLNARDTVIRDWSFRFGATYRRREAIPAMVRELEKEGWLSALAAVGLGKIGVAQDNVVRALIKGLSSKEAGVRKSCATALGELRASAAIRELAKLTRTEKNFQVRTTCCGALGLIGNRSAIRPLKQVLKTKDEVQVVKAEAALGLARLGDRSGLTFLQTCFKHPAPQQQYIGLMGLILLKAPRLPEHLITALGARYEEIWLLAVRTLPSFGPGSVQTALRETLSSRIPHIRYRAALALGLMGDREAIPYIQQALLEGGVAERVLAVELLGLLGHRESIPLIAQRLREPLKTIRAASAIALVRLDAKEALSALVEAAQGPKTNLRVALSRGGPLDTQELMLLLGCIRSLRGEKGSASFKTMPEVHSTRWPEYEKELSRYQLDVLRGYRLIEVMGSTPKPVAVVLRDPHGREQTYRHNEAVASGYRVQHMHMGGVRENAAKDPAFVVLQRGVTRVILFADGRFETSQVKIKGRR